jgi:hypothetical protein
MLWRRWESCTSGNRTQAVEPVVNLYADSKLHCQTLGVCVCVCVCVWVCCLKLFCVLSIIPYLLTATTATTASTAHSRSWALLVNPPVVQLLKNFPAFYGTGKFIAVFSSNNNRTIFNFLYYLILLTYSGPLVHLLHGRCFEPRSGHVGFMADKMTPGRVFSEYFGLPCEWPFEELLRLLQSDASDSVVK